jgi:hypothetical protein
MLKRAATLLLCLVYSINVYGLAFNVNYCLGQITSVKVGDAAKCPTCRGVVKMKCCKTKHVDVKVKDAHVVSDGSYLAKLVAFTPIIPQLLRFTPVWQQNHTERVVYHAQNAPPPDGRPIFIKNCSFRI